ncbi:MAG: hypothetical protein WCA10_12945 [Terracidiphilus sp.]
MKGTLLFRLAILAVAGLAISPFGSAQANLGGEWTGTLEANGTTFHIAWHATAAPDGKITCTFDNIDQNIYGIKVKSTVLKESDITMSVDDVVSINGQDTPVKGDFAGVVSADGNEVSGTWTQTEPAQPPAQIHFKRAASQSSAAATAPPIAGDWSGTLNVGAAQLRLVLHLAAAKDGSLTATLDSVDQGANGIPVNSAILTGSKLSLTVDAVHGTYEGTVNKDTSEITGTWTQGQPLELNFKRAQPETASAAPKPAAPSDIDGTWQGSLDTPKGTLRILFKIVNMDTGLTATMQSPDQSPNWMPTTSVTREGSKLTIDMKAFGASFEGQINAAKDTIDGSFTQGMSIPLVLKKS